MKLTQAVCLATVLALAGAVSGQSSFGFKRGMTMEQVAALVCHVPSFKHTESECREQAKADERQQIDSKNVMYVIVTEDVPLPHPSFDLYVLLFSPEKGLLKIAAWSRDIPTNGFGLEVQNEFIAVRDALVGVYGKPADERNALLVGSHWTQPEYWIMGLFYKERALDVVWTIEGDGVILLTASASSFYVGKLELEYEFDGFDALRNEYRAKQNKAF